MRTWLCLIDQILMRGIEHLSKSHKHNYVQWMTMVHLVFWRKCLASKKLSSSYTLNVFQKAHTNLLKSPHDFYEWKCYTNNSWNICIVIDAQWKKLGYFFIISQLIINFTLFLNFFNLNSGRSLRNHRKFYRENVRVLNLVLTCFHINVNTRPMKQVVLFRM